MGFRLWLLGVYLRAMHRMASRGAGRVAAARKLHARLIRLLQGARYTAHVNDMTMMLNSDDTVMSPQLLVENLYEPVETAWVKRTVRSGSVVLDIGANIGYYTLLFSKLVGVRGKVIAFEPDQQNADILRKNLLLNNLSAQVMQKAVTDHSGSLKLYLSADNKGDHRICPAEDRQARTVPCVAIDDVIKGDRVDFVKMDIQGAEVLALRGMKKLIKRSKNIVIMMEVWPYGLTRNQTGVEEMISILNECKCAIYVLDHGLRPFDGRVDKHAITIVAAKGSVK